MYNSDLLETGEIGYWCFFSLEIELFLLKFEVIDTWYDEAINTAIATSKVIKNYIGSYKVGQTIELDTPWQMQKTLENARRVTIMGIFRGVNAFFYNDPPWSFNV